MNQINALTQTKFNRNWESKMIDNLALEWVLDAAASYSYWTENRGFNYLILLLSYVIRTIEWVKISMFHTILIRWFSSIHSKIFRNYRNLCSHLISMKCQPLNLFAAFIQKKYFFFFFCLRLFKRMR